jgi:hypothetical protein
MVPQLIARVDGLPEVLLDRQVVWPVPPHSGRDHVGEALSAKARARIERQTAGVHDCRLPAWARAMIAEQAAEAERLAIRVELAQAGLL